MDWLTRGTRLQVGGHRGASAVAPENTYPAFEEALSQGAAFTETDIRTTADGYLVLVHDPTLERTTSGQGSVSSMTLAQLRELDAGAWFGDEFRGARIPELPDFLAWLEARAPFGAALEIKAEGAGARVADMAWASPARKHLSIYAFDAAEIVSAKAVSPDLPCVLLLHQTDDPDTVISRIEACGADGADVPWQWNATGLLAEMRERGLLIGGGSDEGGRAARELVELGVEIIDTDHPAALLGAVHDLAGDARR